MSAHKLYKLVVEYTLVISAESQEDAERSVKDIARIHCDYIFHEDPTNFDVEPIRNAGDLPEGWELQCLPYDKYPASQKPRELINKTIKEFFEHGNH
jgi:hypothetical protein